jgi:hypothetical protein
VTRAPGRLPLVALCLVVAGCTAQPTPTPVATQVAPTSTPAPVATPIPDESAPAPATPTATPEPELSLDVPDEADARIVTVGIAVSIPPDADGELVVTVTSASADLIDELVLRWPTELHATLFPAPFRPSDDRIRDGGPPLVQPWTKWVVGPGERGEPEGTVSLGWGPLLPGATLEIPLIVSRVGPGPIAFDLQVLAGNAILAVEGGGPAAFRVEVP